MIGEDKEDDIAGSHLGRSSPRMECDTLAKADSGCGRQGPAQRLGPRIVLLVCYLYDKDKRATRAVISVQPSAQTAHTYRPNISI